jgi:6-phosphogluconolactonase (cycloisomerase 2 family)
MMGVSGNGEYVHEDYKNQSALRRLSFRGLFYVFAIVGIALGRPSAATDPGPLGQAASVKAREANRTLPVGSARIDAADDACTGLPNGSACNDGNACTQTDSCHSGVCTGANPVTCAAADQCHAVGTCNPGTGLCSNPPKANGTTCSDGNPCSQPDTCQAGTCVAGNASGCTADEIFVSNYFAGTITVYPRTANGDVAPLRTIQTGLSLPHTLGIDPLRKELFVPNNLTAENQPSINVYDLSANAPNDAPKRTITGPATGLNRPAGIALDAVHHELYVANDIDPGSTVTVYPLGASGNVAPLRTLGGSQTGIQGPLGIAVDLVHDEIVIANYKVPSNGSITVFPRTATGNVAPLRKIEGALTGFNRPQSVGYDFRHDEIVVANSFWGSSSPGNIVVFPRSASGNVAPARQIAGSTTALCNPIGMTLDLAHDAIVAANSHAGTAACAMSVTTYPSNSSGDAAPTRKIAAGPNSNLASSEGIAVRTAVDCSDPLVADGTPCDDGNACTTGDVCQAGVCASGNPVVCVAPDPCHDAGVCNTATGLCSSPAKADGSPCGGASTCTQSGTCQAGACTGSPVADGAPCSDGNGCTQTDVCLSGTCLGSNPVVCVASDPCHAAGVCSAGTGLCSNPPQPNGTSCNDANACTQGDSCQAGGCVGSSSVVCTAADQCHLPGVCNTASGVCSNPPKSDGSACNDNDACTLTDICQGGICVGGNPICVSDELYVSNYAANLIAVYARGASGDVAPIRTIQTGLDHPHTLGVDLLHQELFVPNNLAASGQPAINVYDLNASYPGNDAPKRTITGGLTGLNRPAGLAVDSVNQELYVANDVVGGSSITVYALGANGNVAPLRTLQGSLTGIEGPLGMAVDLVHDQLIVANYRTTDGGSLAFFNRTADGNVAPIRTLQGPLTGFSDPQGVALDLAHDEIVVANSSFMTSAMGNLLVFSRTASGNVGPIRQISGPDTALCNPIGLVLDRVNDEIVAANSDFGNNSCSESVTTYARTAVADATPVRQIGPGPLFTDSNPASVFVRTQVDCSDPSVANGTSCDDGNPCSQTDTCQGGVCVGGNPVVCPATDQCHAAGVCNIANGVCSNPAKTDGSACDDGNACTQVDACQSGACVGSSPTVCAASDPCHLAGTCDPQSGTCSNPAAANGLACNDGNACTQSDSCQAGVCVGANPIVCTATDPCRVAGTCDPQSGACSSPNAPDGQACDDGSACTTGDACQGGVCTPGAATVCAASDQCHVAGTCNPGTGNCTNPLKADGSRCDDGNACTRIDSCQAGACVGASPVICTPSDSCHAAGACDPLSGACSNPAKPDGATCSDGDSCSVGDVCVAGTCVGGPGISCGDGDSCTVGDASGLLFGSDKATLTWNSAASGALHDLLRGVVQELPVGSGASETCLGTGLPAPTATDVQIPAASRGFWYLVRGRNSCGTGSYGSATGGIEEFSSACP